MNPVYLVLISAGFTLITTLLGFLIKHLLNSYTEKYKATDKKIDDHISSSNHQCEVSKKEIWDAVEKNQDEWEGVTKQISKLDQIDKHLSDFSPKALETEVRAMQKRINILDGGEQFESGRISKLEDKVEKVSKAMNIEHEVSDLKKDIGDLKKDMKEITETIHRLELNLSEKYVTKDTYEYGQKMLSDKMDRILRLISAKFKTGANTQLNMMIESKDDD